MHWCFLSARVKRRQRYNLLSLVLPSWRKRYNLYSLVVGVGRHCYGLLSLVFVSWRHCFTAILVSVRLLQEVMFTPAYCFVVTLTKVTKLCMVIAVVVVVVAVVAIVYTVSSNTKIILINTNWKTTIYFFRQAAPRQYATKRCLEKGNKTPLELNWTYAL